MRSLLKQNHPKVRSANDLNQRINTLIDTVFGIAVTLTIFNVAKPNDFNSLLNFTQTLPAFIFSISILFLLWKEIVEFSSKFHIDDFWLNSLVLLFLSLIIFFVFPLRFLMLHLSNIFFKTEIDVNINISEIDDLMIYYGSFLIAIYALLFLLYFIVKQQGKKREISSYENFYLKWNLYKMIIYISVPIVSIAIVLLFRKSNLQWSIIAAGFLYAIYSPLFGIWAYRFTKKKKEFTEKLESTN